MAPISLAILNPISFVLMEIEKRKSHLASITDSTTDNLNKEKFNMVVSVLKSIFSNPIILMTLLGIIGNLVFHHTIPCYLGRVLDVII